MPNPLTLEIKDHSIFRGAEVSMRHDPAFGIAALMPHAALAPHLRETVPQGGRGPRADPTAAGPRLNPDHGALPGNGTEPGRGRE